MGAYQDFEIETFELGRGQWHACFRPIDRSKPVMIDGTAFGVVNVGVAWPTSEAALLDARGFIDRMLKRRRVVA
jgi:hypothetical protein